MTYQETLDYLFTRLPMYSRIGSAAFKNSLDNIIHLCAGLNNPQNKFRSIHIAGTNGKGSVSHMMAAILQNAGYKTGLYTSPHLYDFRERIKINGQMVPEEFVIHFVEKIKPLLENLDTSFFEITVAMAFDYFATEKVDIAVIEVGLGGRLDSTNIITPVLSVITNISFDHTNMLGNTLAAIAAEKGGIIKQNIPVIIGQKNGETDGIFTRIAQEKAAPVFFAEENFAVKGFQLSAKEIKIEVQNIDTGKSETYFVDLPGIYQTKNILSVLQATVLLQKSGFILSDEIIKKSLPQVKELTGLQGRWEVISTQPLIVLEVAHNEAGVEQMVQHISKLQFNRLHLIIGAVKDKEVKGFLKQLPKKATYYFTQAHIPRALDAGLLQAEAKLFGLAGTSFDDVNKALEKAAAIAGKDDLIIVCGSIFLVAEVNKYLWKHQ